MSTPTDADTARFVTAAQEGVREASESLRELAQFLLHMQRTAQAQGDLVGHHLAKTSFDKMMAAKLSVELVGAAHKRLF